MTILFFSNGEFFLERGDRTRYTEGQALFTRKEARRRSQAQEDAPGQTTDRKSGGAQKRLMGIQIPASKNLRLLQAVDLQLYMQLGGGNFSPPDTLMAS